MKSIEERFWSLVSIGNDDECWPWIGHRVHGYGRIRIDSDDKRALAHRLSWEFANGRNPGKLNVLHRCDNPPCVNPSHLFLGTQRDNIDDMLRKRRQPHGVRHWSARLSTDQVAEIRRRRAAGERTIDLAAEFGIDRSHVSNIASGRKRRIESESIKEIERI